MDNGQSRRRRDLNACQGHLEFGRRFLNQDKPVGGIGAGITEVYLLHASGQLELGHWDGFPITF
jgi:hypothetical protein